LASEALPDERCRYCQLRYDDIFIMSFALIITPLISFLYCRHFADSTPRFHACYWPIDISFSSDIHFLFSPFFSPDAAAAAADYAADAAVFDTPFH
jgi:hypothetical protein